MYEHLSCGKTRDEFLEMAAAPVHIYDWYGVSGKLGNVSVVELKFESNRETERIPDTKITFDAGECTSYSQLSILHHLRVLLQWNMQLQHDLAEGPLPSQICSEYLRIIWKGLLLRPMRPMTACRLERYAPKQ